MLSKVPVTTDDKDAEATRNSWKMIGRAGRKGGVVSAEMAGRLSLLGTPFVTLYTSRKKNGQDQLLRELYQLGLSPNSPNCHNCHITVISRPSKGPSLGYDNLGEKTKQKPPILE